MSDKKAIDEILTATAEYIYLEDGDELCQLRGPAWSRDRNEDRAKLMAAAPEMARLLLKYEFTSEKNGARFCPACGLALAHHDPLCEWLRVMKKAGLR